VNPKQFSAVRWEQLRDRSVNWNDRCPSPNELDELFSYIDRLFNKLQEKNAEIARIRRDVFTALE
jgi:hypothetical protein